MQKMEGKEYQHVRTLNSVQLASIDLLDLDSESFIGENSVPTTGCLIPDLNESSSSETARKSSCSSRCNRLDKNSREHSSSCKELRRLSAAMSSSLKLLAHSVSCNESPDWRGSCVVYEPPASLSGKLSAVFSHVQAILRSYSNPPVNKSQAQNQPLHPPRPPLATFSDVFMKEKLHSVHTLIGDEEISKVIKYIVGVPAQSNNHNAFVTPKQFRRMNQLRSALFKECGFTIKASVLPVMCFRRPRSISLFSNQQSSSPYQPPNFQLIFLLQAKNRQKQSIIIDAHSRVYKNIKDWQMNNVLPPSTLIVHIANEENDTCTMHQYKSPSSKTSKTVLDSVDVLIGLGAVTTGIVVCFFTAGAALPFLLTGEAIASVYMSVRGYRSMQDTKKHTAKLRKEVG